MQKKIVTYTAKNTVIDFGIGLKTFKFTKKFKENILKIVRSLEELLFETSSKG